MGYIEGCDEFNREANKMLIEDAGLQISMRK